MAGAYAAFDLVRTIQVVARALGLWDLCKVDEAFFHCIRAVQQPIARRGWDFVGIRSHSDFLAFEASFRHAVAKSWLPQVPGDG